MRRVIILALSLVVLAACSEDGQELSDLARQLGTEGDFTLHTAWEVPVGQRGRPVTLVVPCFHGPLAFTVDGAALADRGDSAVGEHRFLIPATSTARGALKLALSGRSDADSSVYGLDTPPRIVEGEHLTPGPAARLDRFAATAAAALLAVSGLFCAVLFAVRRRYRAEAVLAVQAFAAVPVALWSLGLATSCALPSLALFGFVQVHYLHTAFGLGRPRRAMSAMWLAAICVTTLPVFGISSPAMSLAIWVPALVQFLYLYWWLQPISVRGKRRGEARIFTWTILATIFIGFITVCLPLAGFHALPLLLAGLVAGQLGISLYTVAAQRDQAEYVSARWKAKAVELAKRIAAEQADAKPPAPPPRPRIFN